MIATDVRAPIEGEVNQVSASVGYATKLWQLQGGYRLAIFGNDIKTMTFDNPGFGNPIDFDPAVAAVPQGRVVLAPDNQYHNLYLAGGVNLPLATRLAAKVAYGINRQNDTFFSHTINPALAGDPSLQLYAPSLRGDVRTLLRAQRDGLPFGLDEYAAVWLHEDDSRADESLIRDLICIRVVEKLYETKYFDEHPEDNLPAADSPASEEVRA